MLAARQKAASGRYRDLVCKNVYRCIKLQKALFFMFVENLTVENFRNLEKITFQPDREINVIFGDNAQGKTNLIEAIYLFSGQKSFRGTKDSQLPTLTDPPGQHVAKLSLSFFAQQRHQTARIVIDKKRSAMLNDLPLPAPSALCEHFGAVLFSPADMDLIKDGPNVRRKFLDNAIAMLRPKYAKMLSVYNRAVTQRNAILRDVLFHSELSFMLDSFEDRIAKAGAYIIAQRRKYLEALQTYLPAIYGGISNNKETLTISYKCSAENGDWETILHLLQQNRAEDTKNMATSIGPHRDDLEFFINQMPVKAFGSQGQRRSVVLSLKLAEAEILKKHSGEQPVAILDDVMSELDRTRQDFILNHITGWQVFITCCDPNAVHALQAGRCFQMENGVLTPI